jgi:hypothetical protein
MGVVNLNQLKQFYLKPISQLKPKGSSDPIVIEIVEDFRKSVFFHAVPKALGILSAS